METRHASLRPRTVPCTLALLKAVKDLGALTGADPSLLARAGLVLVQARPELAVPDPGAGSFENDLSDFTPGAGLGRLWLPRLHLSAPSRITPEEIRVALATLLAICMPASPDPDGTAEAEPIEQENSFVPPPAPPRELPNSEVDRLSEENLRLRQALEQLAPKILPQPPRTPAQAAWLLGFASEWGLIEELVTDRYRRLARIYHPDTGVAADSNRMAQITAARSLLMRHLKG